MRQLIQHLVLGLALATGSLAAHAAIDDLKQTQSVNLVGSPGGNYSAAPGVVHTISGSFEDTFNFSFTGSAMVSASLTHSSFGDVQRITFTEAWLNGIPLTIDPVLGFDGMQFSRAYLDSVSATGNFSLVVKGYAGGNLAPGEGIAASYAGTFNVMPTAVPEPETYAMFLAGLGAVGLLARRRRMR